VLALGATPNVAVVPGAADHALTFKGAGDAVRIRNRVIDLFEAAALTDDPWVRHRLLTFVVVGAGHAGTELIAALEELTRGILPRHYPVGFLAWVLWKAVYLLKLPTPAARIRLVLDWTVELFFEREVSELGGPEK
jgi:NADH:ubiquinone reductase (H+-translocating)